MYTYLAGVTEQPVDNLAVTLTCVGAASNDPGACCLGCLQQPFAEDALQLGLQFEVGDAAMDGDEQLGELEPPLLLQQLEDQVRLGIVGHAHILKQHSYPISHFKFQDLSGPSMTFQSKIPGRLLN